MQPGNTLWRIARNEYGRGIRYTVIFRANRENIRNPHLIYPGQVFTIPGLRRAEAHSRRARRSVATRPIRSGQSPAAAWR